MISGLPPALDTIDLPRYLSPSALGSWGECVLKLAASTRGVVTSRLPGGPEAAIGVLVHRVLESWLRGGTQDPSLLFDTECQVITAELRGDPARKHFANLAETKPLQGWTRLRHWVVERCRKLERGEPRTLAVRGAHANVATGAERYLSSDVLRLGGSADRIRRLGAAAYEVRDFKSGAVLSVDGEVKPEIQLQLRAYGLLVLEKEPRADVRLVVDDGDEHTVTFDGVAQREARAELDAIVRQVPAPGPIDALSVARPGVGCFGCSLRHTCPAYRQAAPGWWRTFPAEAERIPDDTWGRLVELRPSGTPAAAVDAVLVDAADRRVRINGLSARHELQAIPLGEEVAFLQLEATGAVRGYDGRQFHPRVFHELPRDGRERRAWAATCFVERPLSPATTADLGAHGAE